MWCLLTTVLDMLGRAGKSLPSHLLPTYRLHCTSAWGSWHTLRVVSPRRYQNYMLLPSSLLSNCYTPSRQTGNLHVASLRLRISYALCQYVASTIRTCEPCNCMIRQSVHYETDLLSIISDALLLVVKACLSVQRGVFCLFIAPPELYKPHYETTNRSVLLLLCFLPCIEWQVLTSHNSIRSSN